MDKQTRLHPPSLWLPSSPYSVASERACQGGRGRPLGNPDVAGVMCQLVSQFFQGHPRELGAFLGSWGLYGRPRGRLLLGMQVGAEAEAWQLGAHTIEASGLWSQLRWEGTPGATPASCSCSAPVFYPCLPLATGRIPPRGEHMRARLTRQDVPQKGGPSGLGKWTSQGRLPPPRWGTLQSGSRHPASALHTASHLLSPVEPPEFSSDTPSLSQAALAGGEATLTDLSSQVGSGAVSFRTPSTSTAHTPSVQDEPSPGHSFSCSTPTPPEAGLSSGEPLSWYPMTVTPYSEGGGQCQGLAKPTGLGPVPSAKPQPCCSGWMLLLPSWRRGHGGTHQPPCYCHRHLTSPCLLSASRSQLLPADLKVDR